PSVAIPGDRAGVPPELPSAAALPFAPPIIVRTPPPTAADGGRVAIELGESPVQGSGDAKVTVIVFADFQCPFCARSESTLAQLLQTYGDELRIVFKNYPLPFHDDALLAARAALAANEQGKFWPYHHVLFQHQSALDRDSLERFAGDVGMNVVR